MKYFNFILDNWLLCVIIIEILLRVVPTRSRISIIQIIKNVMIQVHELIDYIIPIKLKK